MGSNPTLSAFPPDLQAEREGSRWAKERTQETPIPYCNPSAECLVHPGQYVRVGVEGDRYGGVAQEFLHELGMNTPPSSRVAHVCRRSWSF